MHIISRQYNAAGKLTGHLRCFGGDKPDKFFCFLPVMLSEKSKTAVKKQPAAPVAFIKPAKIILIAVSGKICRRLCAVVVICRRRRQALPYQTAPPRMFIAISAVRAKVLK